MMILADLTAGYYHDKEINPYCDLMLDYNPDHTDEEKVEKIFNLVDIGFYVAPKYRLAKYEFIHSGVDSKIEKLKIGGMVHAHMPGTYYFLANDYYNVLMEE